MRADAEMDALNRNLLRRLEEAATPPVEEQFREMYTRTMMGGETIAERIAVNHDLAEREATAAGQRRVALAMPSDRYLSRDEVEQLSPADRG